jgi:hypothetical protein
MATKNMNKQLETLQEKLRALENLESNDVRK